MVFTVHEILITTVEHLTISMLDHPEDSFLTVKFRTFTGLTNDVDHGESLIAHVSVNMGWMIIHNEVERPLLMDYAPLKE